MSFKSFIQKIKNILLCDKQKDDLCFDSLTTENCPGYDYDSPNNVVVQYSGEAKKVAAPKKKAKKTPAKTPAKKVTPTVKKTAVKKPVVKETVKAVTKSGKSKTSKKV